ncbi:MAG: hypothetical protein MJ224_00080 [archaeon]|nr:hypothetical protein [archaeon]
MSQEVIIAIISSVVAPIVTALIAWIGHLIKQNKKLKKRNKAQAELLNYGAG